MGLSNPHSRIQPRRYLQATNGRTEDLRQDKPGIKAHNPSAPNAERLFIRPHWETTQKSIHPSGHHPVPKTQLWFRSSQRCLPILMVLPSLKLNPLLIDRAQRLKRSRNVRPERPLCSIQAREPLRLRLGDLYFFLMYRNGNSHRLQCQPNARQRRDLPPSRPIHI